LLINKVKTLEELIDELDGSGDTDEVLIRIASCFRTDDGSGDVVTDLKHSDYTKAIGLQVCSVLTDLAGVNTRLDGLEDDVDDLKDRVQVLESDDGELDALTERVEDLETGLSGLVTVLGNNTDLAEITAEECPTSGPGNSVASLAAGDGSALWTGDSDNVAESIRRLWVAMCDVRSAVKIIQDNCCEINCDDVLVDFDVKLADDRMSATLFFAFKSKIPNGFTDYNAMGNKLTITDANGAKQEFFVKVAEEVENPDGILLDFSNTALDSRLDYTFSMDAAMKSESLTCMKCISKVITYKDTCAYCEISVIAGHNISPNNKLVIVYEEGGNINSATIAQGQTKVISKNSVIKSIIQFGDPQYTTTCGDLPDPEAAQCYIMQWVESGNVSGGDPPLRTGTLDYIDILGVKYPVNVDIADMGAARSVLSAICAQVPAVEYVTVKDPGSSQRQYKKRFVFRTTPTVAATMEMHVVGQGMEDYAGGFYLEPYESPEDCPSEG
jgi:hypothetical protein